MPRNIFNDMIGRSSKTTQKSTPTTNRDASPVRRLLTEADQHRRAREEGFFPRTSDRIGQTLLLEGEYGAGMNQALSAFEKSPEGFLTPGSYDKKQAEYFIQSDIGQFPNFLGHVGRIPKAQSKLSNMTGIPLVSSTQSTTHFREPDKSAGASQLRAVSSNASSSSDLRNSKLSTAATPSSSKTARFDPSKYVGEGPYEEQLAKALHESSLQNPSTPSENPFSVPHSQQNSVGSNDADRKGKRPVQY